MKKRYTHVSFVLDNSGSMNHLRMDTIGGYNSFKQKQNEDPGKMTFSLYQFDKQRSRSYITPQPFIKPAAPQPLYNPLFGGPALANGGFVGIGTTGAPAPLPSVTVATGTIISGGDDGLLWGGAGAIGVAHSNVDPSILLMNAIPAVQAELPDVQVVTTFEFVDFKTVPDLTTATYECNTNTPLLDVIGHAIEKTGRLLAALPEEERPEKVIFVILTDGEENASEHYSHAAVRAKIKEQTEKYNWDFLFLGANQDAIQTGSSFGISRGRSMTYAATAQSMGATYNAMSETVSMMKCAVNSKDVNFDETIRSAVFNGTYESK